MTTDDRAALVEQLILHEGLRLKPYVDTVGKTTIGCGRNLTDKGISAKEAADLLDHDLDEAIQALTAYPWFLTLDPIRQRACVDFMFNVGPGTFSTFRHFIAAMARKNYVAARQHLLDSKWHRQVGEKRAMTLADQIEWGK